MLKWEGSIRKWVAEALIALTRADNRKAKKSQTNRDGRTALHRS